ncbi:hypothetical protein HELRODRAFT_70217, partial [Helobdella robusta]|uniref:Uncharacterized protein n=1 Tax=Helobdella robusta TaxID=6412 RepID=T1G035_HELRO
GTAGAVLTCPLEVLKTRLQSSRLSLLTDRSHLTAAADHQNPQLLRNNSHKLSLSSLPSSCTCKTNNSSSRINDACRRLFVTTRGSTSAAGGGNVLIAEQTTGNIIVSEGAGALFKGLLPNLIGVAPSRAIYFAAYAQAKVFLNNSQLLNPDTPIVHLFAAAVAGSSSATCTNPLWVVKTRMQLNHTHSHTSRNKVSTLTCAKNIYRTGGIRAFYKGITASYYGLAETAIHLVVYEEIKRMISASRRLTLREVDFDPFRLFVEYMGAGAISKTIATTIAYPHEVARTRLREEGDKYKKFWQTLGQVQKEEGFRGLYRGLGVQMVRQIPNTAIMMATYEAVVYFFTN